MATQTVGESTQSGAVDNIDSAQGSIAQLRFKHGGTQRWQIQERADAEASPDVGSGSGLAIAATIGANTFTGFLAHALRASGADGLGGPYWDSFAPYVMGQTRAGSPNGTTANFQLLTNPVEAPRTLPGSTPFSTTASAATVFVFAAGCCDVGQPAYNVVGQVFVKLHSAANVGGVSMDVCGVNNGPWYKVNALINVNEFTVALNSGCAATVTTQNGGGSGSTYTPSYATILNNVYTANTSGTPGFQIQTQDVYSANPAFFLPNGTNPSANYQRHYSAIYSPNETSGNFAYTTVDEENDFINHGIDTGWNPIVYKGPNSTIGKFWNAESIANGVGGGTATNWGTAAVCGQSTSFVRVGLYGCVNVMPGALVGATFDPTSHGGVGSDYYGSYTSFGAPWATTHNGTSTVTVTPGARDMFGVTGHAGTAYFPKTYGPFSGVTIAAGTYAMANITSTSFDITGSGSAGANGTFGSIGDTAMISQAKPFAPYQVHGWWKQGYTVDPSSLFDDGLVIHSIPGAGIGWDDGTGIAAITGTEISAGHVSVDLNPTAGDPINAGGPLRLKSYIVSALPTCNAAMKGGMAMVTDAAAIPVYNATLASGGSVIIPVFCNGTNWTNH